MANENPKLNPKLTITLTGRPPVKITKDEWPIIASAEDKAYDNQYECQANRRATWKLIVRQHNDGRTIVYGIYRYSSDYQGEGGSDIRGGELITVSDADAESVGTAESIVASIKRVGEDMEERVPDDSGLCQGWSKGYFPRLIHECIANLPAAEL